MPILRFPFTTPAAGGYSIQQSADKAPLRGMDMNRLILEINAIESAIGPHVHSKSTSLAGRLFGASLAADGMQAGGVICEIDPASPHGTQGTRATRRWLYDYTPADSWDSTAELVQAFPYNIFDAGAPATCAQLWVSSTGPSAQMSTKWGLVNMVPSPNLARWKYYNVAGGSSGASISATVKTLTVGALEVFEDVAPYLWRADSFGSIPGV